MCMVISAKPKSLSIWARILHPLNVSESFLIFSFSLYGFSTVWFPNYLFFTFASSETQLVLYCMYLKIHEMLPTWMSDKNLPGLTGEEESGPKCGHFL